MSTVTPTLIPRQPAFPLLLPEVPKPHPTPLPPSSDERPGHFNDRRNLRNEYEDMSDEEDDIEGHVRLRVQICVRVIIYSILSVERFNTDERA